MIASLSCRKCVERKDKWKLDKSKRNVLPQGAPTSPVFSNMICQRLDQRLTGLQKDSI